MNPIGSVTYVSPGNLVTVTFSEPVKFTDYDTMISNLHTNIDGPYSPYSYSYSIANQNSLVANQTFIEILIQISDVEATLYGNNFEKIQIWWEDLSVITDSIGNSIHEGKITGYLNEFEYLPPEVESGVNNGGQGMKYTIISLFSVNIGIKMFISSSASIMWSLIHVLQVFRYILMINIKMPKIIDILMEYMAIVVGEVDEVEKIVPDVFNIYLLNSSDINDKMYIQPSFQKYGYETPYLTDLYGRQILMFL